MTCCTSVHLYLFKCNKCNFFFQFMFLLQLFFLLSVYLPLTVILSFLSLCTSSPTAFKKGIWNKKKLQNFIYWSSSSSSKLFTFISPALEIRLLSRHLLHLLLSPVLECWNKFSSPSAHPTPPSIFPSMSSSSA